jgi:hypothetical protein
VDPESSTTSAPAVGTLSVPGESDPSGTLREAPAAFDNRTNGFDPQGPTFDTITEDTVVPLRSFNDNRFIFEEFETVADGLGPTFNAQSCRECHQNIVTGGASRWRSTVPAPGPAAVRGVRGWILIQTRSTHPDIFERVPKTASARCAFPPIRWVRVHRAIANSHCLFATGNRVDPWRWKWRCSGNTARGRFGWKSQREPGVLRRGCLSERNGDHNPTLPEENTSLGRYMGLVPLRSGPRSRG